MYEKQVHACCLAVMRRGYVCAAHDVSEGGLLVALAESCLAAETRVGAVLTLASTVGIEVLRHVLPTEEDPARVPAWALERLAVYTQGGYLEQIGPRMADYQSILGTMAILGVPQIMGLFLLGAIAGRLGWLARPGSHARLWRAALWLGVAALPFAAAGAWLNFVTMRDSPGDPSAIGYALQNVGAFVACLYVATLVRLQQRPSMRRLIAWLAPAGRMPLTNYIMQSVVMGLLLSGWGLGLGASLGRAELALLALLIAAAQLAASRAWIGRFGRGPLEALWRRATYGAEGRN